MGDEYEGGFDGAIDTTFDSTSLDSGTVDAFDVDSVMDAGGDDFAQFETPVEFDEPTNQILEMPEAEEPINQILETPEDDAIPIEDSVEQLEVPEEITEVATKELSDVNSCIDADSEQFDDGPAKILKRDEFDLLQAGYKNVNDILDAKIDDYHDKGYSEEEIANQIAKDKWEEQQSFLNDAFPGQDVSPHVFNGFEENGAQDRIDEINQSEALSELITSNEITVDNSSDVDAIMDAEADDFDQFDVVNEPVEVPIETESEIIETSKIDESTNIDFPLDDTTAIDELTEIPTEPDNTEFLEVDEPSSVDVPTEGIPVVDKPVATPTEIEPENIEVSEVDESSSQDVTVEEALVAEELAETPNEAESDSMEVLEVDESTGEDVATVETLAVDELVAMPTETESENIEVFEDVPIEETLVNDSSSDTQAETDSDVPAEQILETSEVEEVPKVDNIQEWLGDVNPNYNPDVDNEYSNNCGSCALATLKKFEGIDTAIASDKTLSIEEMNKETGMEQVEMTPDTMQDYIIEQGAGKMYVVGIDRQPPLAGHWFNAYYDGNKVVAIDGQTNKVHDWPPNFNAVNWDISVRKEKSK